MPREALMDLVRRYTAAPDPTLEEALRAEFQRRSMERVLAHLARQLEGANG